MDSKRYTKWVVPKLYALPISYVYLFIFILGIVGYWYFTKFYAGDFSRWKNVCILLVIIAVYRGLCFKWMHANKQYRLMKQQMFNDKPWECEIVVDDRSIKLNLNGKQNETYNWEHVKEIRDAKSFIRIVVESFGTEQNVMLDKDSFTKGNTDEFFKYLKIHHPDIKVSQEEFKMNK